MTNWKKTNNKLLNSKINLINRNQKKIDDERILKEKLA